MRSGWIIQNSRKQLLHGKRVIFQEWMDFQMRLCNFLLFFSTRGAAPLCLSPHILFFLSFCFYFICELPSYYLEFTHGRLGLKTHLNTTFVHKTMIRKREGKGTANICQINMIYFLVRLSYEKIQAVNSDSKNLSWFRRKKTYSMRLAQEAE